jgi:PAS domain S-box-containing protein
MSESSFINLLQSCAPLLAVAFIFDICAPLHRKLSQRQIYAIQVGYGILIGLTGIVVLLTPWVLMPGIRLDTHSILLGVSGLFFGPLPTLVAVAVMGIFRLVQGGAGVVTGALVILVTGAIGIAWRYPHHKSVETISMLELYLFGMAVHIAMLALNFTLPWPVAVHTITGIALPVLVIYPVVTMLLGRLMIVRLQRERMAQAHQESEDRFHQAAAEIQKREEQYRLLTENIQDVVWVLDAETLFFRYVSPSVEKLRGYSPEEILAHPLNHALVPEESDALVKRIHLRSEAFRTGKVPTEKFYTDEVEQTCKDGSTVWTEVITRYYRNLETGRIEVLGVTRDIHERKRAELVMTARSRLIQRAALSTLSEFLQATLDEVEQLTGSQVGFYHFVNPDQVTLSLQTWSTNTTRHMCKALGAGLHYSVSDAGVWADSIHQRQPVIHNDYTALLHRKGLPEGHAPILRELVVPVMRGGKIVSVLGVGNRPYDYNDQDIEQVSSLADLAWDIAERKRAEEELRKSEEKFSKIFHQSQIALALTSLEEGRCLDVNSEFQRLAGLPYDEIIGRTIFELSRFTNSERIQQAEEILRTEQTLRNFEVDLSSNSGQVRTLVLAVDIVDLDSTPCRLISAIDITERKRAEEALRQSNEIAQDILNAAKESVYLMEADGTITATNETNAQRFGKSVSELVGANLYAQLPPPVAEFRRKQVDRVFSERKANLFEDENRGTCMEHNVYPILNADGAVQHVAIYSRDISDRKLAEIEIQHAQSHLRQLLAESQHSRQALLSLVEDQKESEEKILQLNRDLEQRVRNRTALLEAANKELEAFAYSVSHDLRAPLRSMDGFSQALLEDYSNQLGTQGQDYLNRIRSSCQRMGQLINDLLNLSRVTRAEFVRQQVDLSAIANSIATDLKAQAPRRKVEFTIADDMHAEGDANLLKICLENLMGNAFKFTSLCDQAQIQVGVLVQDSRRIYFVRDNGAGFSMEYASQLFTPFQRLHAVNEFPGSGIGLSIVQRIINRHGGSIWPEAIEGQGATFYFDLGADRLN